MADKYTPPANSVWTRVATPTGDHQAMFEQFLRTQGTSPMDSLIDSVSGAQKRFGPFRVGGKASEDWEKRKEEMGKEARAISPKELETLMLYMGYSPEEAKEKSLSTLNVMKAQSNELAQAVDALKNYYEPDLTGLYNMGEWFTGAPVSKGYRPPPTRWDQRKTTVEGRDMQANALRGISAAEAAYIKAMLADQVTQKTVDGSGGGIAPIIVPQPQPPREPKGPSSDDEESKYKKELRDVMKPDSLVSIYSALENVSKIASKYEPGKVPGIGLLGNASRIYNAVKTGLSFGRITPDEAARDAETINGILDGFALAYATAIQGKNVSNMDAGAIRNELGIGWTNTDTSAFERAMEKLKTEAAQKTEINRASLTDKARKMYDDEPTYIKPDKLRGIRIFPSSDQVVPVQDAPQTQQPQGLPPRKWK